MIGCQEHSSRRNRSSYKTVPLSELPTRRIRSETIAQPAANLPDSTLLSAINSKKNMKTSANKQLVGHNSAAARWCAGFVRRAARSRGAGLVLGWSYGTLETADEVSGPWSAVSDAAAPTHTVSCDSARKFYRVRLPEFCVPLPNPPDPLPSPFRLADWIPFDAPAFVGYRSYLNPATHSGPSYNNIIPDRALWFKLR